MDAPANTLNYMIAGFVVIFGTLFAYLATLVVRWRSLRQDEAALQDED